MKTKKLKKLIGWLHLWLGLAAGLVILTAALTGSLLVFEDELENIIFKERHIVEPDSKRLSADELVKIAQETFPKKKVSRLIISDEVNHSAEVRDGKKGKAMQVAFVNPYNGKVLYKGFYQKQFFKQVTNLHRNLLLEKTGKIITGISCIICLFLVISGLVLWWPANKNAVKQRFKIKWNASGKRLTWDLHAVSGFYLSLFLLIITLTGLVWSYDWVDDMIFKLADGKPQKEIKVKNENSASDKQSGIYSKMENEMQHIYPYSGTLAFTFPTNAGMSISVQKERSGSVAREIDGAYFDSNTGMLIKELPYELQSTGSKIRRMVLPLHTGSIFGWPSKVLALFVVLFTASLPITGTLIWWNKKKKTAAKQRNKMKIKHLITFLILSFPFYASASAYWIDIKGNGKINENVSIKLCYGSMDQYGIRRRDTGKELELTGDFIISVINPQGIKQDLKLTLQKDCWLAVFVPKSEGTYRIVGFNDKHPVVDRSKDGGENILPIDYLISDYYVGAKSDSDLKMYQTLDLAVKNENGKVSVKAFKKGKISEQGLKLRVFNPENWEKEIVLDKNGEAFFYPTMKGLYIIRQDWKENVSGTYQNISYNSKRHRCNYYLLWN